MGKSCYRALLATTVPILLFAGCANPAFQAYEATPIFGDSREVVRINGSLVYRFVFRGGTVTYRPESGAEWTGGTEVSGPGSRQADAKITASLPHGCLVFACALAEKIRTGSFPDQTRSQVIGYKRSDGSGHAFLLFDQAGQSMAKDDRGYLIAMPTWKIRSPAEAHALAVHFQNHTHPPGFPAPVRASFIGDF